MENKTSFKKRVMKFLLLIIIAYFFLLSWLLLSVDIIIFPRFRAPNILMTPKDLGVKYEEISVETADAKKLCCWYAPAEGAGGLTLIYNHGNAENISTAFNHAYAIAKKLGASLFIYDYRGYARSEGAPSTASFYDDCDSVYRYVSSRPELKNDKFIVYGRSLGGAAAVHMASKFPCHRLITESTFVSVPLHIWFNPVLFVFYPFVREYLPSSEKARDVTAPWLIIHGGRDGVISVKNAHALNALDIKAKRSMYIVDEASHNNVMKLRGDEYLNKIYDFVNK
ncbi:MAG TPA: alpha/beta hydrolase [Candidatus Wallbacteria bacterium]|nr:alpha/beta hydrolase [Candidatus Wallbacteria bacterium]